MPIEDVDYSLPETIASITVYGNSQSNAVYAPAYNPSLQGWLFGNPLRDSLRAGMQAINEANSGLLAQNANFAQQDMGILRTLNSALAQAGDIASRNKNLLLLIGAGLVTVSLLKKRRR